MRDERGTQVGVADTQNLANTNVLTTGGKPPYSTIGICQGSHLYLEGVNAGR